MDENTLIAALARLSPEDEIADDEIERRLMQNAVVCAKWPDSTKPHGFDYEVLKGDELLQQRGPGQVTISQVPCKSRDEAIRTRNMFCGPAQS